MQGRRLRKPVRHAAVGHEDEAEAVEEVRFDGLGSAIAAGFPGGRVAAAHLHSRQQPRTTSQGPSPEEAIQHHAKQLPEEFTVSQVSDCVRTLRGGPEHREFTLSLFDPTRLG